MDDPEIALRVKGLCKNFGGTRVLHEVDLTVPAGEVTALLGGSGSGKTVLLRCITGLLEPSAGTVEIFGRPREGVGAEGLGYLFQGNTLLDSLTVGENIALPLRETRAVRNREMTRKVGEMLDRLDLGDIAEKYPDDLSGGMRRRVSLARALIREPRLMLFDEPTTGLDPLRRNGVLEMVWDYQRDFGFTTLLVTHDVPASLLIADHVAMLQKGEITYDGTVAEMAPGACPALDPFLHNEEVLVDELLESIPFAHDPEKFPEGPGVLCELKASAAPNPLTGRLCFPRAAAEFKQSLGAVSGTEVSPFYQLGEGRYALVVSGIDPDAFPGHHSSIQVQTTDLSGADNLLRELATLSDAR